MSGTNEPNEKPPVAPVEEPQETETPGTPPVEEPQATPPEDTFDYSDPEKVKAEIKKLRNEAASKRVSNKELNAKVTQYEEAQKKIKQAFGLEEEEIDPVEQVQTLQAQNEALQMEIELNSLVSELEIPSGNQKYFKFLIHERLMSMEEGDELSEEDLQGIAEEVKGLGGQKKTRTGLDGDNTPPPNNKDAMTVEQFAAMNTGEKSALYVKNKPEYDRLFAAANEKGIL